MTVCERIDNILKSKGMSRRKLAIAAGISPSSFQTAMARNTTISYDMLIPISNVLNVPIYELEGYSLKHDTPENRAIAEAGFKAAFGRNGVTDASEREPISFEQVHTEQQAYLETRMHKAFSALNEYGQVEACKRVEQMADTKEYRRIIATPSPDKKDDEKN